MASLQNGIVVRIPENIKDEFLMLTFTAVHMRTNINTPISSLIGATDASGGSMSGIGGCEAKVPHLLATEIYRKADLKGERVDLDAILFGKHAFAIDDCGRIFEHNENPDLFEHRLKHRKKHLPNPKSFISGRAYVVVHMFAGKRRRGDFHDQMQHLGNILNINFFIEDYDLQLATNHDLLIDDSFKWMLHRAHTGQIAIYFGGPPCGTWSAARFLPGPARPVRTREHLWGLPGLQGK